MDSLSNLVANIGTNRDKRTHNQFGFQFVTPYELEAAYQSNWLARRIVDKPNEDALREWRTFSGKDAKQIAAEERRLGVQQKYLDACCWADLYGGAAMLMITGQDLSKPLDLNKVKKGGLKNIVVFDRWDIQPSQFNFTDPLAVNWMLPEVYTVVNGQQPIHYSHVIRRAGARLPRRMAQFEQGWGDSRLRRCMEDLRDVVATKGGIASLVLEANVDTIAVKGLQGALASPQKRRSPSATGCSACSKGSSTLACWIATTRHTSARASPSPASARSWSSSWCGLPALPRCRLPSSGGSLLPA